jgi:hypothetical protein
MRVNEMSDFLLPVYKALAMQTLRTRNPIKYRARLYARPADVFWRHDVDVSVRQASIVASIDREVGLSATFFINLHADTYNASSQYGRGEVSRIVELGHDIGIHLDSEFYGHFNEQSELENALLKEVRDFEELFAVSPEVFSYHNPSSLELTFDADSYVDLVNCYSSFFRDEVDYVSDSNGFWRHDSLNTSLTQESQRPLQVLTHAEWWAPIELAPRERMAAVLISDSLNHLARYDSSLAQRGRENRTQIRAIQDGHRIDRADFWRLMELMEMALDS